jgi:hypothetical protein
MTLTPKFGYGPNCYVVRYLWEFDQIRRWMHENGVDYWHVSSGPEGSGFQVTSNVEWFNLKWL